MHDGHLAQLKNEVRQYAVSGNRRVLPLLAGLRKTAAENNDPGLYGFADYYAANYCYSRGDYKGFRKYLVRAVHNLLRSGDRELLTRSYNYFAMDAHTNGSLDIACNYYLSALQFVKDGGDSASRGQVLLNLSNLFFRMEYHTRARRFFRKGIRLVRGEKDDPFYAWNMIVAMASDGMNSIAMGDIPAAEKSLRGMKRILKTADESQLSEARPLFSLFEMRLALETGDRALVRNRAKDVVRLLESVLSPNDLMDDIADAAGALMKAGFAVEAGKMLEAVEARVMAGGVAYSMHLLAGLLADYYERTGNRDALMKWLTEQNRLLLRMQEEQKQIYKDSIGLIRHVGGLRAEEQAVREQNRKLLTEARTDALTGLPNRYAMEQEVGAGFEEAYRSGTRFGVGLLDINGFKDYNDTYGHEAGDRCLILLGKALEKLSSGGSVFCARYGGDEFLIVYRDMTDDGIAAKATELADTLSAMTVTVNNRTLRRRLTVSQGVCNDIPGRKTKPWDFLSAADAALYTLKKKRTKMGDAGAFLIRSLPDTYGKRNV